MGFISEFKDFAMRGNVVDMAVGIIIGAAFGKITSSVVEDVMMPPIGYLMGGVDFSNLMMDLPLKENQTAEDVVSIKYGVLINVIINFIIVAFAVFLLVKALNSMKKKEEEAPAAPAADVELLTEIRDLLAKKA